MNNVQGTSTIQRPKAWSLGLPGTLVIGHWSFRRLTIVILLLFIASPHTASACAVCFGDPDSPLAKGLSWGVLSLLAVVLLVLGGIAAFFAHIAKRARMSQITAPQEELQP